MNLSIYTAKLFASNKIIKPIILYDFCIDEGHHKKSYYNYHPVNFVFCYPHQIQQCAED